MIGTGIDVRVKVQDIVAAQLPEFIRNEAPLTDNFLRQFYVSQEFQGGPVDFASNLDQYLKLSNLTPEDYCWRIFSRAKSRPSRRCCIHQHHQELSTRVGSTKDQ